MATKLCWHTLSKIWRCGEELGTYPYCYCTLYTLSFSNGGERFTNVFAITTGEKAYADGQEPLAYAQKAVGLSYLDGSRRVR
jgi:hypothetical protein